MTNKKITFTRGINFVILTVETGKIYDIVVATGTGKVSYAVNCTPSPLLPKCPATKALWTAWEKIEDDLISLAKQNFGTSGERELWWKIHHTLEEVNFQLLTQ